MFFAFYNIITIKLQIFVYNLILNFLKKCKICKLLLYAKMSNFTVLKKVEQALLRTKCVVELKSNSDNVLSWVLLWAGMTVMQVHF